MASTIRPLLPLSQWYRLCATCRASTLRSRPNFYRSFAATRFPRRPESSGSREPDSLEDLEHLDRETQIKWFMEAGGMSRAGASKFVEQLGTPEGQTMAGVLDTEEDKEEADLFTEQLRRLDRATQADSEKAISEDAEDEAIYDAAKKKLVEGGFFSEDEPNDPEAEEDEEFQPDDITSSGHGELEQTRELRELARVITWDMPLLHKHARPFQPPSTATPLRFRYTTYLGETHPGSRKVVVEFEPSALPNLETPHLQKLLKLLGSRYDPITQVAKLSTDRFPTQAQNKRFLADLVTKLLAESREGSDTFADVPLDLRHARKKRRDLKARLPQFPEEWKLTDQRREYLENVWAQADAEELARIEEGSVVRGAGVVDQKAEVQAQQEAVMVNLKAGLPQRRVR